MKIKKQNMYMKTFFLALLTTLFAIPPQFAMAETASGTCGKNVRWTINQDSILVISGTGDMDDFDFYEENYSKYSKAPWMKYYKDIKVVDIKEGVTNISQNCFVGIWAHTLHIPSTVKSIAPESILPVYWEEIVIDGQNKIYDSRNNCNAIIETATNKLLLGCKNTEIPNTVKIIGKKAFALSSFKNENLPNSIITIEDSAFYFANFVTLTIPQSVKNIGRHAFRFCYYLRRVDFDRACPTLGDSAFYDCSVLERIESPQSIIGIGNGAFGKCVALKSFAAGDNTKYIGESAFRDCSQLTSFTCNNAVESIGSYAFAGCNSLTSIIIGDGVKTIGERAFTCPKLSNVTLGSSVQTIEKYAFYGTPITKLTIPKSVQSIGEYAFAYCNKLENLTFNDAPTDIGEWAFYSCKVMKSLSLGSALKTIGNGAFYFSDALTSVTIPASVTKIGERAFYLSTNITSLTIASSQLEIGKDAFGSISRLATLNYAEGVKTAVATGLYSITKVNLPSTLSTIGASAFYNMKISTIDIPESVTSIKEHAFEDCSRLMSITLPSKLEEIGEYAFRNSGITTINIPASVKKLSPNVFYYCTSLTSATLPNGLTKIPEALFSGCWALTTISIPNTVKEIERQAFNDCKKLTSVNMPSSLTILGERAFDNCSSIKSVVFPETLTKIDFACFRNCTSLTELTLPASVKEIAESAFSGCKNILSVACLATTPPTVDQNAFLSMSSSKILYVPEQSINAYKSGAWASLYTIWKAVKPIEAIGSIADGTCGAGLNWYYTSDNVLKIQGNGPMTEYSINYDSKTDSYFTTAPWQSYTIKKIEIGEGVTTISPYAFLEEGDLESVTLPSTLTTIGRNAFYYCHGLKSINLPKSVTSVGEYAFYGCSSIDKPLYVNNMFLYMPKAFEGSYYIPESITEVKSGAFEFCNKLTYIHIPESVKTIGEYAFASCTSLEYVTVPSSVTSIGVFAFSGSTGKLRVECNVEDGYIDNSNSAAGPFCSNSFSKIVVGENVSKLGYLAFAFAEELEEIVLLSKKCTFGEYILYGCSSLKTMVNHSEKPAELTEDVLYNCPQDKGTLYVPANSITLYMLADYWDQWKTILPIDQEIISGIEDNVTASDSATETIYDLSGKRLSKPVRGINIINGKKILVK